MQHLDQAIRERAYHLWIADGRRDGNADAYWLAAQRDILSASLADATMTFAAAPKSETRKDETRAEETKYPAKKAKAATPARKSKRRAA